MDVWVLNSTWRSKKLAVRNNVGHEEKVFCPQFPGHQRAGRRVRNLSVELPDAAFCDDISWTWDSDCLIRRSLSSLWASSEVSGFRTRPIETTVSGVAVEHDKQELVTVGWGGVANPESGVHLVESCSYCGHMIFSGVKRWDQLLDLRQWDGSDIFMVWPRPRFILVTAKVAKLLRANRVKEMKLTPLSAMEPQDGNLTPGPVSYWLPADKLRSIQIPKDIV